MVYCKHCGVDKAMSFKRCINAIEHCFVDDNRCVKESYEKVDSFSFALEADFNAGILFRPNELDGQGYLKCETEDDVAYAAANEMLHRKVTKPIEWWEDASEFLGNEASYSIPVFEYDESSEMLTVSATMHRSKWIEFTSKLNK